MRYFLEIAYKGTNYHGWQNQPNAITIQECIEKALSTVLRVKISIVGAGRTDTGVHAKQMFAHFDSRNPIDNILLHKVNSILPKDIAVYNLFKVKENSHARFDAVNRSYEYRIHFGKNPFLIEKSWQFTNKKLNVGLMNKAAEIMMNYSDFRCFSRSNTDVKTYICEITTAKWEQSKQQLIFYITANRFLRNMVRAIVGTLLDVGEEKISLKEFQQIIESKSRCNAGASAPAKGLFLTKITYPKSVFYE